MILVHGNLSTSRFLEHVPAAAPSRFRFVLPDMRGFGRTEPLPIDATRGLRDWSDDIHGLVTALGIDVPVHLLGWSTGGAACTQSPRRSRRTAELAIPGASLPADLAAPAKTAKHEGPDPTDRRPGRRRNRPARTSWVKITRPSRCR